ncbi:MAG: hypothetical protein WC367_00085 [Methanoregula sp.]|jgi:hypothetical protein
MTIFSIIQSQIMQKKKPGLQKKEENTPPENPDNKKENGPEK